MSSIERRIWAAADKLDAAGQSPTLAAVRGELGGGSYTTIQAAMAKWRERRAETSAPRIEVPAAVTNKLAQLGADLWSIAIEAATATLDDERKAMAKERDALLASRQECAELADRLTEQLDAVSLQLQQAQTAEQRARNDESAANQLWAGAKARLGELEQQLAEARANSEGERRTAADAREALARQAGRIEALETQNAELMKRLGAKK